MKFHTSDEQNQYIADHFKLVEALNFCQDLNAIHKAETLMLRPGGGKSLYEAELNTRAGGSRAEHFLFNIAHLTAQDKADALVLVIKKITGK